LWWFKASGSEGRKKKNEMELNRLKNKATVVSLAILIITLPTIIYWAYNAGLAQSANVVFEHPIGTASYIVWEDSGTYYAKDDNDGSIDYSGTNASQVINNCYGSTATVFLKNANYSLDTSIVITYDGSSLIGESYGGVVLSTASNINLIYVGTVGAHTQQITVSNLVIHGNDAGTEAGIYIRNTWYSTFKNINTRYNYFGIDLYGESATYSGGHVTLENIEAEDNLYAGVRQARHYSSVYRHVSAHNNDIYGIFLTTHAQGLEMYGCFASSNNNTGLYIVGVGGGFVQGFQASDNGYGLRLRDGTAHWTFDNFYTEASEYYGLYVESGSNTGPKYEVTDVLFSNSYFVKAQRHGMVLDSNVGYNTTHLRFMNIVVNNNGLLAEDTYSGVYITDDASANSTTNNLWFTQCWIGNDDSWSVNNYQRGIVSTSNSDYVHLFAVDTQTANVTTQIGISLAGSNNHYAQSWNGTTWLGIWNGTHWVP